MTAHLRPCAPPISMTTAPSQMRTSPDLHRAGLLLTPFPMAMGGSAPGSDAEDPMRLKDEVGAN